jgi:hypothetical protein
MFAPGKSFRTPTAPVRFHTRAKSFQASQNQLSPVSLLCCSLFPASKKVIFFAFSDFQSLFAKHPGWGYLDATPERCSRLKVESAE